MRLQVPILAFNRLEVESFEETDEQVALLFNMDVVGSEEVVTLDNNLINVPFQVLRAHQVFCDTLHEVTLVELSAYPMHFMRRVLQVFRAVTDYHFQYIRLFWHAWLVAALGTDYTVEYHV